ncbi:murein hydrolase activator EnvC family protein [Verrucomicrobiota bacterium sgz303538]
MRLIYSRLTVAVSFLIALSGAFGSDVANVPLADGFDTPVGRDGTKQYYKARGFRSNGHLGEDWNGAGGGDTDLGDPVYATAHGIVVFAQDYRLGWGNVVIVRHAYMEGGETRFVDSLYGHLNQIMVREGQQVRRGQQVGTIGNNRGMYDAHLHFEMRKNLQVGMHRSSFARDFSNYWDPTTFIASHPKLPGGGLAQVPINTFAPTPPPAYADAVEEGFRLATPPSPSIPRANSSSPRGPFKVDRFSDLRRN